MGIVEELVEIWLNEVCDRCQKEEVERQMKAEEEQRRQQEVDNAFR